MKRYALFSWHPFEQSGGWNDFRSSYDSVEEARRAAATDKYYVTWQIVDLESGVVVEED